MFERLFGFLFGKKAAPAGPRVVLEKQFHHLTEEDAEVLGFLSDKHAQQLKFISSFLDDAIRTREGLKGGEDLVNLHFFSAQSNTNLAIAMNHMALLSRTTLEGISRFLGNKIARMDGKNELPLSVSFVIFPAAHRCRESSFLLRQLKDNIDKYLADTVSSAAPFDLITENPQLWDGPFDVSLKSLPTYAGFYGLCGLILESFEAYKDGARFEDVIAPDILENASGIIRIREHMLEVCINGAWTRVPLAVDEIKRRSRSFNRRVHEIRQSFFANVYPYFLLSLHYESLLFSVLDFFPLESALKDAKFLMRWYSSLLPDQSDELRARLLEVESIASGQKAALGRIADDLSLRVRDVPRLDREKALRLADAFGDCLREQFGIANGLLRFDSELGKFDQGIAHKVWRIDLVSNDLLLLAQFAPYGSLLDEQGGSVSPSLKPALEELLLNRSQGRALEVSSELSDALLGLHREFKVDVLRAQVEDAVPAKAKLPQVQVPVDDVDSKVSLLLSGEA